MNDYALHPQDRQLSGLYRLFAPLLAAGVLLSGLTLTIFTGHPVGGWLTITLFLIASLLLGHPRRFIVILFGFIVIHPSLLTLHSHWMLQMADKLLAILLMGVVVVNFINKRSNRNEIQGFHRLLMVFLALAAGSAIINRVNPIQALRFFMTYGAFIPAFYATYVFVRPDPIDARRVVRFILIVFGLQVVLNLGWLAGINPLPNRYAGTEDFSIGTLNSCNLVAYLTGAVLFLLFGFFHTYKDTRTKMLTAMAGGVALLQLVLTFTFHALPAIGLLLFAQTMYGVKSLRYKLTMLMTVGLMLLALLHIKNTPQLNHAFGFPADELMTAGTFKHRWDEMWRGGKGQAYYNIFVRSRSDMPAWILGGGPGNFASGIGIVHRSMLAEKYVNYIYLTYSGRAEMLGGSITQHLTTGVSAIYSELGPFGFLIFFWLHGMAVLHVFRQLRRGAYQDPVRRVLAEAFIPTMLLYLTLNLISDFLSIAFLQVGVWLWAGVVWRPDPTPATESASTVDREI